MPHESQIIPHSCSGQANHESPFAPAQGKPVTDVRSALGEAIAQLERENVPSAALAAELLLMHTLGQDRAWLYAHPEQDLDAAAREQFFSLIARRASGVPTQHLTGHQEFWGLDFEVTADVLIPRPETEHVIEVAIERLGGGSDAGSSRRNATRHSVTSRIDFIECNLLDALRHQSPVPNHQSSHLDLIASNPPYIGRQEAATLPREVREHEPAVALFGGETGMEIYASLIAQAAMLLKPGGILVVELGHNSAEHVSRLLGAPAWASVAIANDLAGIPRVASAQRHSN
jgi:release factor glutamine methyltransferase